MYLGVVKLIRHRLAREIAEREPDARIVQFELPKDELIYVELLKEKLAEEVQEFLQDSSIMELADIREVLDALRVHYGVEEFDKVYKDKFLEKGGFYQPYVLVP
jgi:predicted house-cleaning noncanonical NTP pyrophosphatase (MazG superfamily)